jgi:hypothetical protein
MNKLQLKSILENVQIREYLQGTEVLRKGSKVKHGYLILLGAVISTENQVDDQDDSPLNWI